MNIHKKTILILLPLIFVLILMSSVFPYLNKPKTIPVTPVIADDTPYHLAAQVMSAISAKNFKVLAVHVDENIGLDLKPYYTPSDEQGRHISKLEVESFFSDIAKKDWGVSDGSGEPVILTNAEYYSKSIYPKDFWKLGVLSEGKSLAVGNTYPLDRVLTELFVGRNVKYVEYYISGFDPQYEGMDWQSLALVFEKVNNVWKLIGILHNEWTI